MKQAEEMMEQLKEDQNHKEIKTKHDETGKIDEKTSQDKEQNIKANVANGMSSDIMANYMKYYHLF